MKILLRLKRALHSLTDFLEALGLVGCLILIMPFEFLRRLDRLQGLFLKARFLLPHSLFAPICRASIDERLGNYSQASNQIKSALSYLETQWPEQELTAGQVKILIRLYSTLVRMQLAQGRIDDASVSVIKAHALLGCSFLPDVPDLDVKIAHIVRAGVAAGKLLDEGGLATLMVRQADDPGPRKKKSGHRKNNNVKTSTGGAKIIPFPTT